MLTSNEGKIIKRKFVKIQKRVFNDSFMCAGCQPTFYGINCTLKCSKNCNNQACDHVTGTCVPPEEVSTERCRNIYF